MEQKSSNEQLKESLQSLAINSKVDEQSENIIETDIFRSVMAYQSINKRDSLPKYITSFSDSEVYLDENNNIQPIMDRNNLQKGISVRPYEFMHDLGMEFVEKIPGSGHEWKKGEKKCLELEYFDKEGNKDIINNHKEGTKFKKRKGREVQAYMCYKLPVNTELPFPFRLRKDSKDHYTIYLENSDKQLKPDESFSLGAKDYFYFERLLDLPWELHCFKMIAKAEPSDLSDDLHDHWNVLLHILIKYIDYTNEEMNLMFSDANFDLMLNILHNSAVDEASILLRNIIYTAIDDVMDWAEEEDLSILLDSRELLLKEKISDQLKGNFLIKVDDFEEMGTWHEFGLKIIKETNMKCGEVSKFKGSLVLSFPVFDFSNYSHKDLLVRLEKASKQINQEAKIAGIPGHIDLIALTIDGTVDVFDESTDKCIISVDETIENKSITILESSDTEDRLLTKSELCGFPTIKGTPCKNRT